MASYAKIYRRIWESNSSYKLMSEDQRLLWFYLVTQPDGNSEGLSFMDPVIAAVRMDWEVERFDDTIDSLDQAGIVMFDPGASMVFIPGALKWNLPRGTNQAKAAAKRLGLLRYSRLRHEFLLEAKSEAPDLHRELLALGWEEIGSFSDF